jgi:hypothetical protein
MESVILLGNAHAVQGGQGIIVAPLSVVLTREVHQSPAVDMGCVVHPIVAHALQDGLELTVQSHLVIVALRSMAHAQSLTSAHVQLDGVVMGVTSLNANVRTEVSVWHLTHANALLSGPEISAH